MRDKTRPLLCCGLAASLAVIGCYRTGSTGEEDAGGAVDADADTDSDTDSDTAEPQECVFFVDGSLGDYAGHDGTSWASAFAAVQDGIDAAAATMNDGTATACAVWVAAGRYHPTRDETGDANPIDPRDRTFRLRSGVALYGGFAGGETDLEEREVGENPTILSCDFGEAVDNADNCYHVVTGADDARVDGFEITRGNADGAGSNRERGGGILNVDASPTIANCRVWDNAAIEGGGMANSGLLSSPSIGTSSFYINLAARGGAVFDDGASPRFEDCTFLENEARSLVGDPDATGKGGALYESASSPRLLDCVFDGNWSNGGGAVFGGLYSYATFVGCTIANNSVEYFGEGGAVLMQSGASLAFVGCEFTGNSSHTPGAAIRGDTGAFDVAGHLSLVNCAFAENLVGDALGYSDGGALALDGFETVVSNSVFFSGLAVDGTLISSSAGSLEVTNSILWSACAPLPANTGAGTDSDTASDTDGVPTVTYSDVRGGCWVDAACTIDETGNLDEPPLFANLGADPGAVDLRLQPGSPCIDSGSTASLPRDFADIDGDGDTDEPVPFDIDGNPRVQGAAVDMGPYETTP